jgi:hypothetical protein
MISLSLATVGVIEEIDVEDNMIGEYGIMCFCNLVRYCNSLKTFNLKKNR